MTSDYYHRPIQPFLRDPPKNLARSAYAVEVTPWTTRGDIEAALLFRGAIISAHGENDHRLSSLCIRCSYLDEYLNFREKYPYTFLGRLNYLRRVFEAGPLHQFENLAKILFHKLEDDFDFRNLVAHARMKVITENWIVFQDFPATDGKKITMRQEPMPLAELERRAWKATLRSRACQFLYAALDDRQILPPLVDHGSSSRGS